MLATGAAAILAAPRELPGPDNSAQPTTVNSEQTAQELLSDSHHPRAAARSLAGVGDDAKSDTPLESAAPFVVEATVGAPHTADLAPPTAPDWARVLDARDGKGDGDRCDETTVATTAGDANAGGSGATVYDPHNGAHTRKGATREGKAPAPALAPPGSDAVVPPPKPEGPARDRMRWMATR